MRYRALQRDDLKTCAEVFVEVFNGPPWNEDWSVSSALPRLTEIAGTPGFEGLKVLSGDRMTGFLMGYIESFDAGGDFYLKEMCVLPDMQRRGIGTALLDQLKARLIEKGAEKLYLLTARDGPAAQFYEKNGFYTSDKMIMMGHWLKPKGRDVERVCTEMTYVRFEMRFNALWTQKPCGMFAAFHKLRDGGIISDEDWRTFTEMDRWFIDNLPMPPFTSDGNPQKAITWFKGSSTEMIARAKPIAAMLSNYGIDVHIATSTNPGRIIYEDEWQVGVIDE
jgi:ribosomal protein S18 acetylase RimI-like enzyme